MADNEVKFDLTPKQRLMLVDLEDVDEVLFGGQAGGGKSESLLIFAFARRMKYPRSVGIMLRRTFRELDKSLIRKAKFNPIWTKYAKWNEEKKQFLFYNGSIEEFGYLETDNDLMQYQSAEYADECWDELTHFPENHYQYMKSRLRPQHGEKGLIRAATNPGNIGHQWVRDYFVAPARERITETFDEDTKRKKTKYFLPASLEDNTMMSDDERANYRSWLNQMREEDRRMLRDGDWDYVPGAAFSEWNHKLHVTSPIPIPQWAKIGMSFDFGFGAPFSCNWYWVDYDGRVYMFMEWYGCEDGKPDKGIRMSPTGIAKGILEREAAFGIKGRIYNRIADPSIFNRTPNMRGGGQGPSIAEMMGDEEVYFNPADNDRIQGKQQIHSRLEIQEDGLPLLMIYDTCIHFLRTMPVLKLDDNNIEDVNSDMPDHAYDSLRYYLMSRPIIPHRMKPKSDRYKKKPSMNTSWMAR